MALTRITKGVIKPNENYDTHNINSTGIVTAIGLDVNGNGDISGNLSVGGVLTYEDVTSIDSVGIITAQKDIHVGAGVSAVGVGTFGSLDISGDIDVDGHTNLDNVSVAGVSTFSDTVKVGTGITFDTIGDAEFCGVVTFNNRRGGMAAHFPNNEMAVFGNNYLYGNIRNTGSELTFDALNKMRFNCWDGNSMEQWMGASGVSGSITLGGYFMGTGSGRAPRFQIQGSNHLLKMYSSEPNSTTLTERFSLSQSGINFTGLSTHTGNFDLDGDLDVDGHTNLDNVSIAGVTTMGQTTIFTTGGTTLLLKDSDSTNPADRSGIAFIDQNNTQTAFIGKASASDAVLTINNTNTINPIRLKVNNTTRLEVGNAGVYATGSLSATGTLTAGSTLYIPDEIQHSGDADTKIRFPGNDTFTVETAGSERIRINSSGSVGIGTDNPSALLHLHKTSGDTVQKIESSNGAAVLELRHTNGYGYINYRQDGAETFRVGQIAQFTSYSVYNPNSSLPYQFCVEGNGEVGINTHNPGNTLHLLRNTNHGISLQKGGTNPGSALIQVSSFGALNLEASNNLTLKSGGSQQIFFNRGSTENARFDTGSRFLLGHTANIAVAGSNPRVQVTGTSDSTAHLSIRNFSANTTGAILSLAKSRGSVGAYTAVQDDDVLGQINFAGADGTDLAEVAGKITVACDATVAGNRVPSRMEFHTTDGNGNLDLNMVLTRDGHLYLPQGITRDAMFALAHSTADDFILGRTTGNADTGMTLVSPSATSGFINFADADGQRQGSILYQHGSGSDKMFFRTNNNQTGLIIDSAQKVYVGDPSGNISPSIGGKLLVSNSNMSLNSFANNSHAQTFHLTKSRGTSGSGGTIVQDNDFCGHIEWYADDGVDTANQIAKISGRINGTPGANDTPGELIFYTTADGANSSTERLRIEADGRLVLSNSGGIQLSATASNLYSVNGALSYYAANNAVYLNGAGDSGLLRLNATGAYNDRTSINLYGKDVANYQDTIQFRTVSEERLRIKDTGETLAKTLDGNFYPVASARDGSTSARAASSAWEIKKTLGPAAKTGYYYLKNPYDNTVSQWWCDMTTDGGGWILVAHVGDGQMSSQSTADGNHWWNRSHKGGFDTVGSGYYKGGGYWRKTNGAWGGNTCGQLMWDVRTQDSQYDNYSNAKVVFNWGTDQALPTGGSGYTNIPNAGNRRFNEWCYEVVGAPGFNPSNYHQNERSNIISGGNYFTEHMVMTWCFRGTGGGADDGDSGPYWMIGSHHDGLHQHYEESLSGGDGVYGDGGYYVVSNEDTGWGGGGSNGGFPRIGRHTNTGVCNVWLR